MCWSQVMKKIFINILLVICLLLSRSVLAQLSAPLLAISSIAENISLSWTEVSNATGYQLYYAPYPYQGDDTIK